MGGCLSKSMDDTQVIKTKGVDDIKSEGNHDFKQWALSHKLKDATIDLLVAQELDDFQVLKSVSENDLQMLQLKLGQLVILRNAIEELRNGHSKIAETEPDGYLKPQRAKEDRNWENHGYLVMQHTNDKAVEYETILKAMFDFTAQDVDELHFKKDDKMLLLESDNGGWCKARHLTTGEDGYVPSDYVAKADGDIRSHDWWIDIERNEAIKLLLEHGNTNGTFLVRNCSEQDTFALSVKFLNPDKPQALGIRHYKINLLDGRRCYLSEKRSFAGVANLIEYYKDNSGLCCKLLNACPQDPGVVPFKEIEIDRESINILTEVGHGNFGVVYKGKWRNQLDVAVKQLKPGSMFPEEFLKEAKIMHKLRHRKLVQLMGVCSKEEPMYIIAEYMVNGCLKTYLVDNGPQTINFRDLLDMAAQIADGLSYLEKYSFIHRDIRAANMLVGTNNIVKVADFGLARMIGDGTYKSTGSKFPVKWTSPESLEKAIFTIKSDVWSFGVLLYELVTYGGTPYPELDNKEVMHLLTTDPEYRMKVPPRYECPQDVYAMMLLCWNNTPAVRPTFMDLHSFFSKYQPAQRDGKNDEVGYDGLIITYD